MHNVVDINNIVGQRQLISSKAVLLFIKITLKTTSNFFMLQVSEKFRSRALKFPGLISGCTIDWFFRWPRDALTAVARHFLEHFEIVSTKEVKDNLINLMGELHDNIADSCGEYYDRYVNNTFSFHITSLYHIL